MSAQISFIEPVETEIAGLWKILPKSVGDDRGLVREFFRASEFARLGLPAPKTWSQINMTWTRQGAIRGLHGELVTKLVGVAAGEAFGAYLDARQHSATFGRVVTVLLAAGIQMLVPPGVCNAFQATSPDGCQYLYCFDQEWRSGMPGIAVNPLDPELGISWPILIDPYDRTRLSSKDASAPSFAAIQQRRPGVPGQYGG